MVQAKSLQVVLLLFLTGLASSRDQWEWFPTSKFSWIENLKNISQTESLAVLDCYSVQFYLATREDPNGTTKACLKQNSLIFNGIFNTTKPTKILVHGWRNSRDTSFTQDVTQAYLEVEDVNVIQVDWSKDANVDYLTAAYRVPEVGYTLAKFILQMVHELDLDVNDLHLIGFSLGAHVVGIAGYYTTPKIARVIGLDPAGPLFESQGPTGRISTESGLFVVTLHTCKYRLGTSRNWGHINFNANNGMSQPGCWDSKDHDLLGFCSHDRAPQLFAASLIRPDRFLSTECDNYLELELGMCDNRPTTYFNGNVDWSLTGTYFFRTTSVHPFTIANDTSEQILLVRKNAGETTLFWQRQLQPKTLQHFQPNKKTLLALMEPIPIPGRLTSPLKTSQHWKSGQLTSAVTAHPGLIPKDEEASHRMGNFSRVLHHMLGLGKRVDAKKLIQGTGRS